MGISGVHATASLLDTDGVAAIVVTICIALVVITILMWSARRTVRRAALEADRSRIRFEAMVEHSSDLIAVLDTNGCVVYLSPSVEQLTGVPTAGVLGNSWDARGATLAPTDIATTDTSDFDQLLTTPGSSAAFEYDLRDRHGNVHRFEAVATNLLDEPAMRGVVLNSRDITDRAHLEAELREREHGFRVLFEANPHPMWVYDNETRRFLHTNDAACQQYGYSRDEFAGMVIFDLRFPEDRDDLSDRLAHGTAMERALPKISRHRTKAGRELEVEVRSHQITFEGHSATLVLAQDVTERRRLETALEHSAFHDPLTALPNRALFQDRMQHALDRSGREATEVCVLLLDLDGFKAVNDTLGHAAGDQLLGHAARRLQTCVRPGDTVARMGGDEFAILLERGSADESRILADRLLVALREPFTVDGQEFFLTASVGMAASHAATAFLTHTELLSEADLAMYDAKASGRDCARAFKPYMRDRATERQILQTDLQHALRRNELRICYQPVVDLQSLEIAGLEALLRWEHPDRGLISPVDFIPLAEETGLIVPIGRWVLNEACRQAAQWQRSIPGRETIAIAVNVSGRQLQDPKFVDDVRSAIAAARINPGLVTIEITESVFLIDTAAIRDQLGALKQLGVNLAIDDFGTGYSSLSYLNRFPLDVMKIDKSFLADVTSADRHAFIGSIVDMGHTMQMLTVGEGIETIDELELLRACGCDFGQGYLFARPVAAQQAGDLLSRHLESSAMIAASL